MNKTKYKIQVRLYTKSDMGNDCYAVVETIQRVIYAESIGNFNPIFCRYKGNKRVLIHSDAGDVSDPFRCNESYAESFFITV